MSSTDDAPMSIAGRAWRCLSLLVLGALLTLALGLSEGNAYQYNPRWFVGCVGGLGAALIALRSARDVGLVSPGSWLNACWQCVFGMLFAWEGWSGPLCVAALAAAAGSTAWLAPGASMRRVLAQVAACVAGLSALYVALPDAHWEASPVGFALRDLILFQAWWPRQSGPPSIPHSARAMAVSLMLVAALYAVGVRPPALPDYLRNAKGRFH